MSSLHVLALNSGSSSLKFGLYRVDSTGAEKLFGESITTADHPDAITQVASVLAASGMPPPDAIGHRIVHGGPLLRQHCRIDDAVLRRLQAAGVQELDHQLPAVLARLLPGLPAPPLRPSAARWSRTCCDALPWR